MCYYIGLSLFSLKIEKYLSWKIAHLNSTLASSHTWIQVWTRPWPSLALEKASSYDFITFFFLGLSLCIRRLKVVLVWWSPNDNQKNKVCSKGILTYWFLISLLRIPSRILSWDLAIMVDKGWMRSFASVDCAMGLSRWKGQRKIWGRGNSQEKCYYFLAIGFLVLHADIFLDRDKSEKIPLKLHPVQWEQGSHLYSCD